MRQRLLALALLTGTAFAAAPGLAARPTRPAAPATAAPPPGDSVCRPLPALEGPGAFVPGETLRFELDAMGAKAGHMTMRVLPLEGGLLPLQVEAETNNFFNSIRKVRGTATSWVDPVTLRPKRYSERAQEDQVKRHYDVTFRKKQAAVSWTFNERQGRSTLTFPNEAFDVAGLAYLARRLPMKEGQPICLDLYGVRRIWRLSGTVGKKERVSLPLGDFDAWHFAGEAVRLDSPRQRREVHVWISDDARRLPLAALGTMDLGAVRATLIGYERPGEKATRLDDAKSLKW